MVICHFVLKTVQIAYMAEYGIFITEHSENEPWKQPKQKVYSIRNSVNWDRAKEKKVRDYSGFSMADTFSVAFADRADDAITWILISVLSITFFISRSMDAIPSTELSNLEKYLSWKLKDYFLLGTIFFCILSLYIIFMQSNPLIEIHGTFFCKSEFTAIKIVQYIEGLLKIILIGLGYIPLIYANQLINYHLSVLKRDDFIKSQQSDKILRSASWLFNSSIGPVLFSTIIYSTIYKFLQGKYIHPAGHQFELPFPFAFILFGYVGYFLPYFIMSVRFASLKPDKIRFKWTVLGLLQLFWIDWVKDANEK
jgi:hypothetical protein